MKVSVQNLEKRNVELKLLLRRNNISLDDSPTKEVSNITETNINITKQIEIQTVN